MDCLPREIILNILSRLPATTLLQIKFVCRTWRDLLQDSLLVSMHSSHASAKDPCIILHSDCPIQNQLCFVDMSSGNPNDEKVRRIHSPAMPEFDLVGSCNGLLCFCNLSDNTAHVFNPFTRAYMELPKSTHNAEHEVVFGFGFHSRTKEYKVIKIVYFTNVASNFRYEPTSRVPQSEVQIFTLGSSNWRSLREVSFHLRTPRQVLLNGRLHWVSWYNRFSLFPILISFDLAEEKFRLVPKPICCGMKSCGYQLVDLGGCLSAAAFCNSGNFEIWVMKEYGVEESWVKEYKIGTYLPRGLEQEVDPCFKISKFYLNSGFVRVLCLLKNGEILLEYECRALVSYDPKHGTFKDVVYQGMPDLFETVVHIGSINWIDSVTEI